MELSEILKHNYSAVERTFAKYGETEVSERKLIELYGVHGNELLRAIAEEVEGASSYFLAGFYDKLKGAVKKGVEAVKNIDTKKVGSKINDLRGIFGGKTQDNTTTDTIIKDTTDTKKNNSKNIYLYAVIGVVALFLSVVVYLKFIKK